MTPEPGSVSGGAGGRALLERSRALDAVARVAAQAERGRARVVIVSGPAGSGRSALLDEVCDALGPTWTVRSSPPAPGSVPDGPVAVLVDDADDVPAALVADVAAAAADGRVALSVLALRAGARTSDVVAAASPVHVDLHPLSPGAVAELCDAVGAPLEPGALHRRTAGLPALVAALLEAPQGAMPPAAVRHARRSLGPLGGSARHLAELLAVAPGPVPVGVAERAGGPDGLAGLRLAGLVHHADDGVALAPPLLGEVVRAGLTAGQQAARRRHLARSWMAAPDACPAAVGALLAGAGDGAAARDFLLRAADAAVVGGDPAGAVARYLEAQRSGELDADHLVAAACAAASVGRPGLAQRWAGRAEARLRTDGEREAADRVWQRPELAYVRRAAARVESPVGSPSQLAAHAEAAARRREPGADVLAHLAATAATEAGDAHAASTAGVALLLAGQPAASRAVHDDLRSRAVQDGDHLAEATQLRALSRIALAVGDPLAALLHARAAVAAAERVAGSVPAAFQRIHLAAVLTLTGDLEEAARITEPLIGDPDPTVAAIATIPLAGIDLGRGQPARALARLAPLLPHRDDAGPDAFSGVLLQVAEAHVQQGDHERARAVLAELDAWAGGQLEPTRPDRLALAGRIAAREGDVAALQRLAAEAAAMSTDPAPAAVAVTELLTGLALRHRDEPAAAVHLRSAAIAALRAPRAGLAVSAWLDAAEALTAAGRPVEAATAVDEARRVAEGRGIHAEDGRLADLTSSTAPQLGGAHLTPRERSLLGLLTEGSTNRQMAERLHLSEKTVRNQLSTLFAKLGVERRSQAAVLATQLGIAPPPDRGTTGADDVPAPVRPCGPAPRRR